MIGAALLLVLAAVAEQPTPEKQDPESSDSPAAVMNFAVDLGAARSAYLRGDESARSQFEALFQRLRDGEQPSRHDRAEAMIFLGELQFISGEEPAARETFRWLLSRDPDAPISPYDHPLGVVGAFEIVRRSVLMERDAAQSAVRPPPRRRPPPATTYLPFGIPQLQRGRIDAGVAIGGLQVVAATTSTVAYFHLRNINRDQPEAADWDQAAHNRRVGAARWAVQAPATAAFYGIWIASIADARRDWRKSPPRVGVTLDGQLSVSGHW